MCWRDGVSWNEMLEPEDEAKWISVFDFSAAAQKREQREAPPPPQIKKGREGRRFHAEHQERVLAVIQAHPKGLTILDVVMATGITRTSCNHAALWLLEEGVVRRVREAQAHGGYQHRWFAVNKGGEAA